MNLEGRIVKYHVPEEYQNLNSGTPTAPALVVTDHNPDAELEDKLLNLRVLYDGTANPDYKQSILHHSKRHTEFNNWELYEEN